MDRTVTKLIRRKATLERRGVSSSTHGEDVSNELWTKPVKASKHSSSWPEYEVEALIAARIAGQSEEKIQRLVRALEQQRTSLFVGYERLLSEPLEDQER